jgi:predicted metal-dependent peptidase
MANDLDDPVYKEIVTARVKLLFEKPFFGQLAARLIAVDATKWCKTAATDGKHLFYNRNFVADLSKSELLFLIGHEVLHCFPPETIIDGSYKNIEDCEMGDFVHGQNGAHSHVVAPMSSLFDGNMITVKARGMLPVRMTEQHPVLVSRPKWKLIKENGKRKNIRVWSDPKWVDAADLSTDDWIQIPRMEGTVSDYVLHFDMKGNAWSSPEKIHNGVKLNCAVAKFLGWYVAEGCTTITKDGDYQSTLVLASAEKSIVEELKVILLEEFGIKSSVSEPEPKNTCRLHFSSAPLGRWLIEHCGKGSKQVKIPHSLLYNTDMDILSSFLKAYISGDGHVKTSVNFCTASKVLALQVQTAFARFGVLMNLFKRPPFETQINGKTVYSDVLYTGSTSWNGAFGVIGEKSPSIRSTQYFGVDEKFLYAKIYKMEKKPYFGMVYNIETTCHTFAVGGLTTHNCVYDHLGRRGGRDPKIWNMANDFIVNWVLKDQDVGTMPASGLYDAKFDDSWHSEILYEHLIKNSVTVQMTLDEHLELGLDGGKEEGKTKGNNPDGSVDVTVIGRDGPPKLTEEDLARIRNDLKAAIIQTAQSVGAGKIPAGIRRMISDLIEPKMDWRALLDAHIRSCVKDDYTFQKPGRRTWGAQGDFVFPSQNFMNTIDIAVSIDASGSMSEEMLRDILSEVKGIMQTFRDFKLRLWTFDTKVYNEKEFTPENLDEIDTYDLGGGGGTLFECNWEYMKSEGIEPQRFVMFTDGYPNSSWGEEFYCDTLFVIHGNTSIEAPFGVTAYYEPKDKK